MGGVHLWQDALWSPKEHRSRRTRPARHHSRETKSVRKGDLRCDEKVLVPRSRGQARLPDTQGPAGGRRPGPHRLDIPNRVVHLGKTAKNLTISPRGPSHRQPDSQNPTSKKKLTILS